MFWAVSHASRPLERIHGALLLALEEGRLATPLAPMRGGELAAVNESFNRMASGLEGAVRERQQLLDKLLSMEERTRRMIAHDLHDELDAYLVAVRPHLSILEFGRPLRFGAPAFPADARRRPPSPRRHGGQGPPPARVAASTGTAGPGARRRARRTGATAASPAAVRPLAIELDVHPALPRLAATVESSVFRIVQERLSNALKHSDCSRVVIGLTVAAPDERLQLEVWNDGNARDQGFAASGFGVLGIRERALALGGQVEAGAVAGGGWRVTVALPLERPGQTT